MILEHGTSIHFANKNNVYWNNFFWGGMQSLLGNANHMHTNTKFIGGMQKFCEQIQILNIKVLHETQVYLGNLKLLQMNKKFIAWDLKFCAWINSLSYMNIWIVYANILDVNEKFIRGMQHFWTWMKGFSWERKSCVREWNVYCRTLFIVHKVWEENTKFWV